ncbi:MAG: aldehyde dehydrogenase family protein [Opitutales bacterium]
MDETTEMGPLVSETQKKRVLGYYEKGLEEGATAVLEGGDASDIGTGYYVRPYLLEGGPDNVCFREEIFGPTAYLTRFSDDYLRDQTIARPL